MEVHNPTIIEGDYGLEQEVHVAMGCALVQMHITDWDKAQREDPVLSAVFRPFGSPKEDGFKDNFSKACLL